MPHRNALLFQLLDRRWGGCVERNRVPVGRNRRRPVCAARETTRELVFSIWKLLMVSDCRKSNAEGMMSSGRSPKSIDEALCGRRDRHLSACL